MKSDDVAGRTRMYEAIVKGDNTLSRRPRELACSLDQAARGNVERRGQQLGRQRVGRQEPTTDRPDRPSRGQPA